MLVGIHQLHYLPWLRYMEKVARCDVFVVLDDIQFNKNGWQNRNKIKTSNGATLLTVPVGHGHDQTLDQVVVAGDGSWRKKHWATIEQAYSKAAFFDTYAPLFAKIYQQEWGALNDLNRSMLELYVAEMGIKTKIRYSSDLNVPGDATERLANLIEAVGGDEYYSGAFALDAYLDADYLQDRGISLKLQQWSSPEYPQVHGPYIGDLAIIDLLMNCGPDSLDVLMRGGN